MDYIDIMQIANQFREADNTEGLKEIYEGNIDIVEQTEILRKDYMKFLFEIQDYEKGYLWLQKCLSLAPNDPELQSISKKLKQGPQEDDNDYTNDYTNNQPQQNFNPNKIPQMQQMANAVPNAVPLKQFMNQGFNPMATMGMKDMIQAQQPKNIKDQITLSDQNKKIKNQEENINEKQQPQQIKQTKQLVDLGEMTFGPKQQSQPQKQNQLPKQQNQPEEKGDYKALQEEKEKNYDEKFNDTVKKFSQACQSIVSDIKKTLDEFQEIQIYLKKKFQQFTKREEVEIIIQYVSSNEKILQIMGPQNEKESQAIWIVQERNKIYGKISQLTPFEEDLRQSLEQLYISIVNYATNKFRPEKHILYQQTLTLYTTNFFDFFANHQFLQSVQAYEIKDIGNFQTDYEEQLKLQQIYIKLFANNHDVLYIFLQKLQKHINNLDQRIDFIAKLNKEQLDNLKSQSRIHRTIFEQLEYEHQLPEIIVALNDVCILVFHSLQYTDELLEAQDVCLYLAQKINDQYNIVI